MLPKERENSAQEYYRHMQHKYLPRDAFIRCVHDSNTSFARKKVHRMCHLAAFHSSVRKVLVFFSLGQVHLNLAFRTIYIHPFVFSNLQELATSLRNNLCNCETCFLTFISTCSTPRTMDFCLPFYLALRFP